MIASDEFDPARNEARSQRPLGVFDSGLGGLTVVHALRQELPKESIVYLGDTARVPYGTRSPHTVVHYARGCTRLLTAKNVKAIVIACNTASAFAVDLLQAELDVPVLGVIEPGAEAAVIVAERHADTTGHLPRIGVLGTAGTIASGAYPNAVRRLSTRFEVVAHPAPLLVPLVEEGWLTGEVPTLAIERYLAPLIEAEVSVIVLGCTHYPLLKELIAEVASRMAEHAITVVDSAEATARYVAKLLEERGLGRSAGENDLELLVTDLPSSFETSARRFLGETLPPVAQVDIPMAP